MPKALEQLLKTAIDLHSAGDLEPAARVYDDALALAPRNATALLWSGVAANQLDRFDLALTRLTLAIEVDPRNATALLHQGIALNALGRAAEAVEAFQRSIALDDANPDAFNNLGVALEALARPVEAAAAYRSAIALNPDVAATHANLGNALRDSGDLDAALAAYQIAASMDPGDVWTLNNLANAQLYLGRTAEAIATYRRALSLAPDFAPPRANLCKALFETRQVREAMQEYRAAINRRPDDVTLLLAYGQILYETGAIVEARGIVEKALSLEPGRAEAHMLYASCLDAQEEPAAASTHRARALAVKNLYAEDFIGARKRADILMLACPGLGNLPTNYLLSARHYKKTTLHPQYPLAAGETLPPHDVIFNIIADPDVAEDSLRSAEGFLKTSAKPLINAPAQVMKTKRHLIADLLSGLEGVVIPRTIVIDRARLLAASAADLLVEMGAFPFLIRPSGSHGGENLEKIETLDAIAPYLAKLHDDRFYLTQFVDYSDEAGLFRKYRVIFVDRKIYPLHLCIDRKWKAHYYTSLMREHAWMREEEAVFLADIRDAFPPPIHAAAVAVAEALDLDYAGMDCSITRDGKLLVFEANANMLVHLNDPIEIFPYKHQYVPRVADAVHAMIDARRGT